MQDKALRTSGVFEEPVSKREMLKAVFPGVLAGYFPGVHITAPDVRVPCA